MIESQFQIIHQPELKTIEFIKSENFVFDGDINLDIEANVETFFNDNPGSNEGKVDLSLSVFGNKELNEVPFVIKAKISGYFRWDDSIKNDDNLIDSLLNVNAPAILYSYLRPLLSSITLSSNLPPLVLPLMNFTNE